MFGPGAIGSFVTVTFSGFVVRVLFHFTRVFQRCQLFPKTISGANPCVVYLMENWLHRFGRRRLVLIFSNKGRVASKIGYFRGGAPFRVLLFVRIYATIGVFRMGCGWLHGKNRVRVIWGLFFAWLARSVLEQLDRLSRSRFQALFFVSV